MNYEGIQTTMQRDKLNRSATQHEKKTTMISSAKLVRPDCVIAASWAMMSDDEKRRTMVRIRKNDRIKAIETRMLKALLRDLRKAGYQPAAVWDGEQYQMADERTLDVEPRMHSAQPTQPVGDSALVRPMTDREALAAINSVDECTLHFTDQNATTWGRRGVLLILGNGVDVICDHHVAEGEPFGQIIDAICQKAIAAPARNRK